MTSPSPAEACRSRLLANRRPNAGQLQVKLQMELGLRSDGERSEPSPCRPKIHQQIQQQLDGNLACERANSL